MLGLINRTIQCFLRDTYGGAVWADVSRRMGVDGFESLARYPAEVTEALLAAATTVLDRPRDSVLEDLGTYLVAHPAQGGVRRLLRFGAADFGGFLHSLEDLPDRARLALPELDLPHLTVTELEGQPGPEGGGGPACSRFRLCVTYPAVAGAGHVLVGLLRAMADDFGALAFLDHRGWAGDAEVLELEVFDTAHAEARPFLLASGEVP